MKKRLYIGLAVTGLGVLSAGLAGLFWLRTAPEGVLYHGKSVQQWALQLRNPDPKSHQEAAAALKAIGPVAVPGLVRLLHARDSVFRNQVWAAVPRLPAPVDRLLISRVAAPNAGALRIAAAQALAVLGPDAAEAVPALASSLVNDTVQVRWNAAAALGRIGTPAWSELSHALASSDPNLRYAALCALGDSNLEPRVVVPALLGALGDTNGGIAVAVAGSLSKVGPGALPFLTEAMTNSDAHMRQRAARAVPFLHAPRDQILPTLLDLLHDPEPACRLQALRSLGMLGVPNRVMLDAFAAAQNDPASEVRLAATQLLGQWHRQATPAISSSDKDPNPDQSTTKD